MKLRLAWPTGYYSLYIAKKNDTQVFPQETGFKWIDGSATERNRIFSPMPSAKYLSMIGIGIEREREVGVKFSFCSKIDDPSSEYFSSQWPPGRYCILRKSTDPGKGKCPPSKFILCSLIWSAF